MRKWLKRLGPFIVVLVGLALVLYPVVSNWIYENYATSAITEYGMTVEEMTAAEMEAERDRARAYNDQLTGTAIQDPFIPGSGFVLPEDYLDILDIGGTMGYIEIPKIDVSLPIYHGTAEETLQKGVGHMERTALPIGGEGNHTVLTGHRGLSRAKLFTDLDQLEIGDMFYLHVLDETLAYQVDQITVILPTETDALRPVEGEDYVTLLTCTPYAVNTHRLLVRGTRVELDEAEIEAQTEEEAGGLNWPLIAGIGGGVVVAVGTPLVIRRRRKTRRRGKHERRRP